MSETKPITATGQLSKFNKYIFNPTSANGKDVLFTRLGYSIQDSDTLLRIYLQQAAIKYSTGEYTLGKLGEYGQKIYIDIEIPGVGDAAGQSAIYKSVWMIDPDGSIRLVTPFGGK